MTSMHAYPHQKTPVTMLPRMESSSSHQMTVQRLIRTSFKPFSTFLPLHFHCIFSSSRPSLSDARFQIPEGDSSACHRHLEICGL